MQAPHFETKDMTSTFEFGDTAMSKLGEEAWRKSLRSWKPPTRGVVLRAPAVGRYLCRIEPGASLAQGVVHKRKQQVPC